MWNFRRKMKGRFDVEFPLNFDEISRANGDFTRWRRRYSWFEWQLYRAGASRVMRFKKGAGGTREPSRRGMVKGKERQRQKVSVLRPCGIRPLLWAHDSRKSLRLGIAPPRPPESTCRPLLRVGGRNWWRTRLERDYRLRPLLGANILLSLTGYIGVCVLRSAKRSGLWSTRGGFTLRLICSIILRRTSGNNRARVVNLRHEKM